MQDVVIVAATRTPIGSFHGALAPLSAVELGSVVIRSLLEKTAVAPEQIDEVIFGEVLTAGCGQNPARANGVTRRTAGHHARVNPESGVRLGHEGGASGGPAIRCGDAQIVIAGGQESMSNAPYFLDGARAGLRLGHASMKDSVVHDGLWDAFNDYHMGITAENLADKFVIGREQQDAFALRSQQKAAAAIEAGRFSAEITPVSVPQGKKPPRVVDRDEQPRPDTQAEKLAQLKPAFRPGNGTVTAGNASSINDGAAAVMLMSAAKAAELNLPVLARVAGYAVSGVDPAIMGIGPVEASLQCLKRAGWTLNDVDLIEANEAFAAQALAVGESLNWDSNRVNVNGGAIALGHPIGASGCRILVTLLHEMARRNAAKGLATLCVGGGQGVALAVERPQEVSHEN